MIYGIVVAATIAVALSGPTTSTAERDEINMKSEYTYIIFLFLLGFFVC